MRKKAFYLLYLLVILSVTPLPALGMDDNVPQVKIIHFGVGNADCILIIVKAYEDTGKPNPPLRTITALIDTGGSGIESQITGQSLWPEIWERINQAGANRLDYFVISHIHEDHIGNARGILEQIQTGQYDWNREMIIIDRVAFPRSAIKVTYNNLPGNTPSNKTVEYKYWTADQSVGRQLDAYNNYYDEHFAGGKPLGSAGLQLPVRIPPYPAQRHRLHFGQDLFKISRGYNLQDVQMVCIAANGVIGDGEIPGRTKRNNKDPGRPKDENDLGFAFVLRFGSFRYYTGADLGFEDRKTNYTNMEGPLVRQLSSDWMGLNPFHACALKVNHHGAKFSTGPAFVQYFNPRISVFSTGRSNYGHPTIEAINRLLGQGSQPPLPSSTLLYTFSLRIDQASNTEDDADPLRHARNTWKFGDLQDISLTVKKEDDGSPFNEKQPKIYLRRLRRTGTYAKRDSMETAIPHQPDHILCDRLHNGKHENLALPSRVYTVITN